PTLESLLYCYCLEYVSLSFFLVSRRVTGSALFPYTTLFRSSRTSRRFATDALASCVAAGVESAEVRSRARSDSIPSAAVDWSMRSEEHTSELQSRRDLVCRLLLEKKKYPPIWVSAASNSWSS